MKIGSNEISSSGGGSQRSASKKRKHPAAMPPGWEGDLVSLPGTTCSKSPQIAYSQVPGIFPCLIADEITWMPG